MSVTGVFKNIGHFFATGISKFLSIEPKIEAGAAKVEAAGPTVEAIESAIPVYGPAAVNITKAGEMALGAIVGMIHVLGEAAQAKLLDAGLDITTIQTAEAVYQNLPGQIKQMASGN